jgi:hypothetical protein
VSESKDSEAKGVVKKPAPAGLGNIVVAILLFVILISINLLPYLWRLVPDAGISAFMLNAHMFLGKLMGLFIVVHLILNRRRVTAVKGFAKAPPLGKIQYCLMFVILAALIVTIVSGIFVNILSWAAPQPLQSAHSIGAWVATFGVGIHIALHYNKFLHLLSVRKSSKAAKV